MKKYIAFLMPCIAAMLASCTQNEDLTNTDNGRLQEVTISVTPDNGMQTRATTSVSIDRYVMEVYEANGTTPANVFDGGTNHHLQQSSGSFSLTLDRTKTYKCLFWADKEAGNVYDVSSLKAVTLKADQSPIEASYYGVQDVNGAEASYSVTLKHAVARITLFEKDYIKGGSTLKVTCNRHTAFNVSDGTVTDAGSDVASTISVENGVTATAGTPVQIGSPFYLLAPATEGSVLEFKFQLGEKDVKTASNVPVRANHATNIKGEFSSATQKTFTVTADDEWGGNKPEQSLQQLYLETPNTLTEEMIRSVLINGNTQLIINGTIGTDDIDLLSTFAKATENANAISILDMGGCTSIETEIPQKAFYEVQGLCSVILPEGIETIETYAFSNSQTINNLYCFTSVTLPETLKTIGEYAFRYGGLTTVVIPANVTEIVRYAFQYQNKLESVTFKGQKPPTVGASALPSSARPIIYVPKGCVDAYKTAISSVYHDKITELAE